MASPWLTIVTAVRNDPVGLERTLNSIPHTDGVEVLVIDGSTDRDSVSRACGGRARVEWVEPRGIYAAMNEGVARASGEYVQFINAGDELRNSSVLELLHAEIQNAPEWLFGPVEIVNAAGLRVITPEWDYRVEKHRLFSRGFFPQHQGVLVRAETLRELRGFNTSYAIGADYELFLRLSLISDPRVLSFVVATFYEGGASTQQWKRAFAEFHRARIEVLRPSGLARLQEAMNTTVNFAQAWTYRTLVEPLRARR